MSRYDDILTKLDSKRKSDLFICNSKICACKGCCGFVGSKKITKQELDMYRSGEMRDYCEDNKGKVT